MSVTHIGASPSETENMNGNLETVSKLSDIVKSNIPEPVIKTITPEAAKLSAAKLSAAKLSAAKLSAAKLSDIVKGVGKPPVATQSAHSKDMTLEKQSHATTQSRSANASSKSSNGSGIQQKTRPNHLMNGTHVESSSKTSHSKKAPVTKSADSVASGKVSIISEPTLSPAAKKDAADKDKGGNSSGESKPAVTGAPTQASPTVSFCQTNTNICLSLLVSHIHQQVIGKHISIFFWWISYLN